MSRMAINPADHLPCAAPLPSFARRNKPTRSHAADTPHAERMPALDPSRPMDRANIGGRPSHHDDLPYKTTPSHATVACPGMWDAHRRRVQCTANAPHRCRPHDAIQPRPVFQRDRGPRSTQQTTRRLSESTPAYQPPMAEHHGRLDLQTEGHASALALTRPCHLQSVVPQPQPAWSGRRQRASR